MVRMRLGNLGFSEVSFGSFLVAIFKVQFWFIVARFWLKNYGPILPHLTVLIFVRITFSKADKNPTEMSSD